VAEIFDSRRPSRRAEAGRRKRLLTYGVALSLASVVAVTAGSRWRHRPSKGAGRGSANIIQLTPLGSTRDLSKVATTLAEVDGEISCLTVTGPRTARMVWGAAPRRAEDLDLTSGQRHPSVLASETYSLGCPDLSPSGKALLFASPTRAGAAEIRISDSPDGRDGTTVTAGSDPIWLGTDDEFLYQVDSAHVATFSRPTMTMSLLAAPTFGEHHVVIETAANRVGSAIAALLGSDRAEFAVTVYDGERFDSFRTFALPQGAHIQFADENDLYLTSFRLPGIASAVVTLDWKHGTFVDSAYYPGFDIRRATLAGNVELLTLRHVSSDAWSDGPHKRKLTSDGNNFSVATTRSGDLLLSKKDADGNFNIWRLGPNGRTQKLTSGKWDMGPDFAPDESSWAYADYSAKSIVVCTGNGEHCRVLRRDDMLPIWPRFSPDGRLLAYVTQVGAPKLRVISTKDATVSAVWDAYYQCPPIWSSTRTLWDLEMSGAKFSWYERNAITGARTGRQAPAPIESVETNEINCRPEALGDDLPPKPSAHIEVVETSRVVRTPRAAAQ
jgi:hypothetical protein